MCKEQVRFFLIHMTYPELQFTFFLGYASDYVLERKKNNYPRQTLSTTFLKYT